MTTLMAIGGAMDKESPVVMREFIRRAGGAAARIVILPQASAQADTGEYYIARFKELGAGEAVALEFRQRGAMDTPEQIDQIRDATGIFLTGGAQMRIAALYGGTKLEAELLAAYRRGCLVGGTSAGAAILSKTMIAYGKGGPTPRERIAQFSPGLGFTDKFIFDQHFRQRDRLGRLIYAVAAYPGALGVGLDENTAAIVEDDVALTVCGAGGVTLVDGRQIGYTDVAEVENRGPVAVSNLKIHVLTHGSRYQNGEVFIPEKISLNE
ncbi:MAG: cyanophycinase [Chloroflexi bacterium]|nr:MAG: cyanophycinase [Chloroflexota bacterium]